MKSLSAEEFAESIIQGFKKKAAHNKSESMIFFVISMLGALLAPLFITLGGDIATFMGSLGNEFILSKLVPTVLSIAVAFSTGWLQLRKPQQLWSLYRTSQRELEDNLYKYQYKISDYENHPNPDKLLIERVSKIALESHYSWLPMVPNPENIQGNNTIEPNDEK